MSRQSSTWWAAVALVALVVSIVITPGSILASGQPMGTVAPKDRATVALLCASSLVQCDPKHTAYTKGLPDELVYPVLPAQGDAPTCSAGELGGCGAFGLDWHNYDGNALVGSVRSRPVTIPIGVTAVQLRLKYVKRHPIVGATGVVTLQILAWDGVTSIGSATCSPTTTATDCVTGSISVTPGAEYLAQIAVNPSGTQSSFLASRFSVEPVTSSMAFWGGGFVRADADGIQWGINPLPGTWSNLRRPDALSYSEIKLRTSASSLYIETWANVHDYLASGGGADARSSFTVDTGSGSTAIVPENIGGTGASERRVNYSAVTNAVQGGAPSAITLRSGQQAAGVYPAPAAEARGVYFGAVYAPASAFLAVDLPPKPWAVGATDSKGVAYPSSPLTSLAGLLRARGYAVDWWGIGGDALVNHVPSASVTAAWPWAQSVATHNPALVLLQLQRNDWTGGTASATIYGLQQSAYDAVNKAVPWSKFRVLQITKEGTESTVGGIAWDTHRGNVKANACASTSAVDSQARSNGCAVVQTDGLWTSAECAATTCAAAAACTDAYCACGASRCANDTVHLADAGNERQVRLVSGENYPVPSVLLTSNVTGWWSADSGISGGTLGSLTTGGTGSTSVTGTATRAVRLAYEVSDVSGGTGHVRLSYDGGKSWPEQAVAFSTSGQTIALPTTAGLSSLGLSIVFANTSYNNLYTARGDTQGGAWADLSGHGNALGLQAAATYPTWSAATSSYGNQPTTGVTCATGSHCWKLTGVSVAPPYAIMVIGNLATAASSKPYVGRTGSTAGLLIYATSSTVISWNDGTTQAGSAATTPGSPHCLIVDYHGTAGATTIYLDGVVSGTPTTSAGNNTLTNAALGFDAVNSLTSDLTVAEWAIVSGGVTSDQARGICARSAFKYGTP